MYTNYVLIVGNPNGCNTKECYETRDEAVARAKAWRKVSMPAIVQKVVVEVETLKATVYTVY